MTNCLTPSDLEGLLAETLSPEAEAVAKAHVTDCGMCHKEFEARRADDGLFADIKRACRASTAPGADDPDATVPGAPDLSERVPVAVTIEGYDILAEIHHGGQGVVYKAVQKATKRTVAIKVLLQGPYASPRQRDRFKREIQTAAKLRHANIVTVYDSGVTPDNRNYFSMEYVHGQSLDVYLSDRSLSIDATLRLFKQICDAVNCAHQNGVIHRDLKPGNIQIDAQGAPHILDFGLAKIAGPGMDDGALVTETGVFMGTLPYASPEQAAGDPNLIDTRTDVYSLGLLLYQMLTGGSPYCVIGPMPEVLKNITEAEPGKPSGIRREIDDDVDVIVLKALAKEKERRYQSVESLGRDVERYLNGEPIDAKRDSLWYILSKRLRRQVVRHRLGASLIAMGIAYVASAAAMETGIPLRILDKWFDREAHRLVPETWSEDVAVLALDDSTYEAIPDLAKSLGLESVALDKLKSWRSLHGALMRKLAQAGPRAVVWDICFRTPEPLHDDVFVEGIEALHEVGTKVVVGVRDIDGTGRPAISPPIAAEIDGWGWISLRSDSVGVIRGALLAEVHLPQSPRPSLSLAAFAAARHADYTPNFSWDRGEQLQVKYSRRSPENPRIIEWNSEVDVLVVTETDPAWSKGVPKGTDCTHRHALYTRALVPSREVLAKGTLSYRSVFLMDNAELRSLFEGKIIVIGDNRFKSVRHPDWGSLATREGYRDDFFCYMHAAAIGDLLTAVRATRPERLVRHVILAFAAIAGTVAGKWLHAGRGRYLRWLVCVMLSILMVAVAIGAAARYHILISPTSAMVAIWIAAAGAAWIGRATVGSRPLVEPTQQRIAVGRFF